MQALQAILRTMGFYFKMQRHMQSHYRATHRGLV